MLKRSNWGFRSWQLSGLAVGCRCILFSVCVVWAVNKVLRSLYMLLSQLEHCPSDVLALNVLTVISSSGGAVMHAS